MVFEEGWDGLGIYYVARNGALAWAQVVAKLSGAARRPELGLRRITMYILPFALREYGLCLRERMIIGNRLCSAWIRRVGAGDLACTYWKGHYLYTFMSGLSIGAAAI